VIAVLVVSHVLVLALGVAGGLWVKRSHWIELGRTAERQEHGWLSSHYLEPAVPRQRRWSQRDRKQPEAPELVERHITPTKEAAPHARSR
jgi:hypothetical protein